MNFRVTAILVAVAVLLGLGVYLFEFRRERPEPAATAGAGPLWEGLKAGDVMGLKVTDKDGKTVDLTKSGADWQIVAPNPGPGDAASLDNAARQLTEARATRKIEAKDVKLDEFGLQPPLYVVTLRIGAGERVLNIGDQTPDKLSVYVQKPGDPAVYLVSNAVTAPLAGFITRPPVQPTPLPALTVLPPAPGQTPPAVTPSPRP